MEGTLKKVVIGDCTLYCGDCLEVMPTLDVQVDMVLADLPYGTTACKWDTVIPFEPLWACYKAVTKRNAAIVLTASQPFTSRLVMSNPKWFKYQWVWVKSKAVGFVNAKLKPMPKHEDVLVFSEGTTANNAPGNMAYYPQGLKHYGQPVRGRKGKSTDSDGNGYGRPSMQDEYIQDYTNYPTSVLEIGSETNTVHPTQKPVALGEYLIKTYTNDGETVLDNTMGSGSFGVSCVNTGRHFIGIESNAEYFDIACKRIEEAYRKKAEELPLAG